MIKRSLLLILFICTTVTLSYAQRYGTAVGLRLGNNDIGRTVGISAQQRIAKGITVEGILQSDFDVNTTFSLLLEKHHPIISKRFNYYYGAGVSFGKEESFIKDTENQQILHTYGNATTGVDLIAGLELTLLNTAISLDYKPNINISGREEFFRGQVGISARMVLVKSKQQKKNQRKRQRNRRKSQKNSGNFSLSEKFNSIFNTRN